MCFKLFETRHFRAASRENWSSRFPTSSDTNRPVQSHMLESWNFGFNKMWKCIIILAAKTKVLISCVVTVQLICAIVFTKAKIRVSHDAAHLSNCV